MLVVTRFAVPTEAAGDFLVRARTALAALEGCAGFCTGHVGRAVDEETRWVLVTRWDSVGAYRRALSAYQVRVDAAPLLALAEDEAGAFEILAGAGGEGWHRAADADTVGLGAAAAADVPTDLDPASGTGEQAEDGPPTPRR